MVEEKKNPPKKIVVKSNRLIEARSRLSVQEQRVLLSAISQIQPTEDEFSEKGYPISIAEFRELADLKGRAYYSEIKELTAKLVGRMIVIHEEDGILQTTWLSSAKYYDQKGLVYLNFDQRLKPYLIQLKKEFTSYQLHYVMKLNSKYSTRIYELLKQYEKIGKRSFTIKAFRETIALGEGKYTSFGDLNRNVIKKAKTEINKNTDIKFECTFKKEGRKVVGLAFEIKINKKNVDAAKKERDLLKIAEPLFNLLPEKEHDNVRIKKIIIKYLGEKDVDFVKWNILYVNAQSYKDYYKYLLYALRRDYGRNYQYQLFEEKEKRENALKKERDKEKEQQKIIDQNKAWEEEKRAMINGLSDMQQEMLFEIAIGKYAKKRRKEIGKVDPKSFGVFMEAASIVEDFIKDEIIIAN